MKVLAVGLRLEKRVGRMERACITIETGRPSRVVAGDDAGRPPTYLTLTSYVEHLNWAKAQFQFLKPDELAASVGHDSMMVGSLAADARTGESIHAATTSPLNAPTNPPDTFHDPEFLPEY